MMKILIATDGTKFSSPAIEIIAKFNLPPKSEIKIVSVIDMAVPLSIDTYIGYMPTTVELEKFAREHAEKILSEAANYVSERFSESAIIITTDVLIGSPESRIVETAEEIKADLIIIGSHGYNRWERLLLGSVSDSIVHHAPCSVLIVRLPKI
ncbi:MAG: universal stress protein [Pyrinomonadaceae bacterium]